MAKPMPTTACTACTAFIDGRRWQRANERRIPDIGHGHGPRQRARARATATGTGVDQGDVRLCREILALGVPVLCDPKKRKVAPAPPPSAPLCLLAVFKALKVRTSTVARATGKGQGTDADNG
jgi:hypothetical protein